MNFKEKPTSTYRDNCPLTFLSASIAYLTFLQSFLLLIYLQRKSQVPASKTETGFCLLQGTRPILFIVCNILERNYTPLCLLLSVFSFFRLSYPFLAA